MSDSSRNGSLAYLSAQASLQVSPNRSPSKDGLIADESSPLANLSEQILDSPAKSPTGNIHASFSLDVEFTSQETFGHDSSPSTSDHHDSFSFEPEKPDFSSEDDKPRSSLELITPFVAPPKQSVTIDRNTRMGEMIDEATSATGDDDDEETVLNFSMLVKSRVPVPRPDDDVKDKWDNKYAPSRYRPQVLVNDWFEVTQRLDLNKYRSLKLQKGPHQSAYDQQFQHPFAKKMEDPEECARKRDVRTRKLWTYLTNPTEYSENFNEPYRKK